MKMTATELGDFLRLTFPQVADDFVIEAVGPTGVSLRLSVSERHLRPGGTVSGPTMFALADVAMYLAILSQIGPVALAVTVNCSIDFMRKPQAGKDLIADARILKLGRSLVVGDVLINSEGRSETVARASLTYSLPPAGPVQGEEGTK